MVFSSTSESEHFLGEVSVKFEFSGNTQMFSDESEDVRMDVEGVQMHAPKRFAETFFVRSL